MRILDIRFTNLNSLTGSWRIDLTHPDYSNGGIFAITGPTGSGKTTILDAVCLGLYGRTPRLDKVTKSTNEIMSRHSGECSAEVTFETQKGRFRCHWSQRRARKRPDGELQPAKHEISDADSGRILESKITLVEERVEKVTGMDFERFTRSMLLAQGGFAAFLQASPDKRAPILEQITGTGIYSRISIKAHERSREESEKLHKLESELMGIRIFSDEEEIRLQDDLQEKQGLEKAVAGKIHDERLFLAWVDGIAQLTGELSLLNEKKLAWEVRQKEFAGESKRLARALQTASVEGIYHEMNALRRHQEADTQALADAQALLPEKETARDEARKNEDAARLKLQDARSHQVRETETLRKVRELDAWSVEKKKQMEASENLLAESRKKVQFCLQNISQTEALLRQAQKGLEKVRSSLEKQASDAALPETLAAIGKSFAAWREIEAKYSKSEKDLPVSTGKKMAAFADFQKFLSQNEKIRQELESAESDVLRLTDERKIVLRGREESQWRNELEDLKERKRQLIHVLEIIIKIIDIASKRHLWGKNLQIWQSQLDTIFSEILTLEERKAALEKDQEYLEIQVALLLRIRNLEEERKHLEDGRPCPLCGATEHPYAAGNVPEWNQAEQALKKIRSTLRTESAKRTKLEAQRTQKEAELRHGQEELAEMDKSLEADEKQCSFLLKVLGISAESGERETKVKNELAVLESSIFEISGLISEGERTGKKEKALRSLLERKRENVQKSDMALQDARHALEKAEIEQNRLERECGNLKEDVEKARAEVLREVAPFGITEIVPVFADQIFQELCSRKRSWEILQDEKKILDKKISDFNSLLNKDLAVRETLEKDMAAKAKEQEALAVEYDHLCLSRLDLFADKNPDREEKRLADAVMSFEQDLEQRRGAREQKDQEVVELKSKITSLVTNSENRARDLGLAGQSFQQSLDKAGLENEEVFLASRLSEERITELSGKEQSLSREKTELEARIKDKSEALAVQQAKNLTLLSSGELLASIESTEREIAKIRREIGAIEQSIQDNLQQKEFRRTHLLARDLQKKEWQRWDALRELIGSSDGKKFRNFAQGLTFEMMTAYANRQLRKMTDRYLLLRDETIPLELNVVDHYQAGEVRSTKNLSGGESFIVSLALALGLSRMASQNVRVDSLFLDEGFGALDDDALETALDTLSELRQDGKLIGVISHVPALKERIGTQIQVIPQTGGRSELSGPGCFRC
ncbi:MAG: AAA family ATPase [Syntrophaceae bacterium]|jgi:DNA repair protein SbcC/Rad50|nr:AAA family ATPase [Syntrophaceae bacterium]